MVVTTSLVDFFSKVFSAFSRTGRPGLAWTSVTIAIFALLTCAYVSPSPASAAAGINRQINFQGRLLNSQGATVADGFYNIQFKIYQDGAGTAVGNPGGTLMWTESHLNNNSQGVTVKNGFLSVQLGSINAFGSQIDWNQDTLWLSMNIGNTNLTCTPFSSCSPDGEMVPMKRMTATPYALNSGLLNGLASSNFVQLAQGVQADATVGQSSIFINKTVAGNLLQLQSSGNDAFTVSNAGDLVFGAAANHTISVATAAAATAGKTLTMSAGAGGSGTGSAGGDLVLAGGAGGGTNGNGGNLTLNAGAKTGTGTDGTITIGAANTSSITLGQNTTITTGKSLTVNGDAFTDLTGSGLTVSSNALTVDASSSTGFFRNGGNSFATSAVLGTNDSNTLAVRTNSVNRATFDTAGTLYLGDGITSASTGTFTVQGSTGAASNAGYGLSLLGGTGGSNSNGGDVTVQGGTGTGSGVQGQVKLSAGGYTTTTISAYGSNSTISQAAVDNYSSVAISASAPGLTITVPAPTTKYNGRVLYVQLTGSNSITLAPNGGSSTSMSTNSVYALVWNTTLNGWLAAGTDSNGFIQNQNASDQTANFRINGTGQAANFRGGSLDTIAASGTLTLGGTNATTVNVGNSTAATAVTLQGGTSGTAISIQSGAAGTISVGTANAANTIAIGSSSLSSGTQTITIGGANTAGGTQNVTVGSDSGAAAGATTVQSKDNTAIKTNGTTRATFDTTGKLYLGDGITSTATGTFTVQGSTGAAANAGYGLTLQGGTGGSNSNGGNLTLQGGTGTGSGVAGQVKIGAGGFTTATTQNFTASASITQANVDNFSSIEITASGGGPWTATLPAPTTKYNGRLLYLQISTISGATTINIAPNGGTTITMSAGTGVTLIWNTTVNAGAGGWLNAGADSGSNSYIQNQSAADQTASFRINGQAIAPTFKSKDSSGSGNSDNLVLKSGDANTGSNNSSGTVTIKSGDATGGNASSGNLYLDVGSKTGSGTTGSINIGTSATNTVNGINIGKLTVTTANAGNLTIGTSAGSGTTFTNNGATVNTALAVSNDTDGGALGGGLTAAQSVDIYTSFTVNQTTASQTITLPNPTNTAAGRIIYIANIGSASFGLLGSTLNNGSTASLLWNGSAWTFAGADGTSINNQKVAGQNGDFWIQAGGSSTGVGRADGGLQGPSLERATSGTLSMGTTANTTALTMGTLGVTTTNQGNLTIGTAAGSGTTFTNNGATLNGTKAVANDSDGGSLGGTPGTPLTAAQSVDIYTSFTVNQTTGSQSITLPSPTNTAAGRIIYIANIGSVSFGLLGSTLNAGSTASLLWNGTAWTFAGADGTSINNQNAAGQNGDFWIQAGGSSTGVGRADGGILAPSLERATSGTMNVGTTSNTTALNLGNTNSTTTTTIQGGVNGTTPTVSVQASTNAYIAIGTTNANTVQIGTVSGSNNSTVNIANSSAGAQTVNVGSSSSTSTTTILGGVNGTTPTVSIQGATNAYLAFGTTNANTISIGTLNSAGTTNLTIGSASGATAGTTTVQSKDETIIKTNGITKATFAAASDKLFLGNGTGASGTHATPSGLFTIQATSHSGTGAGEALTIQAGNSGSSANGANLTLSGGTSANSVSGLVILTTPTFQNAGTDANCYTGGALVSGDCTIHANSVNNNSSILVGFSVSGKTASLPDPTITTPGRVVYVIGANGSSDFTLSVNGGGSVSNLIALRANATATMVWNGSDWTAAGASSSTTLQAAYDNTLQSAGGAELIVGKTSNTNGLTIRDSTVNPVSGPLVSVQSNSAANLFSVNSNVTEYASNAGAETKGASDTTFPSSTWSSQGTSTVSRNITTNNNTIATGQASVSITPTAADSGAKNQIVTQSTGAALALTANNHYNVSFAVRLPAGASTFTDLKVEYSRDGTTTALTACASGQSAAINVWTKINCSFTAPASGITTSNAIMIRQAGSATRTFYVDNLSVTIAADYNLTTDGGVDDAGNFASNWDKATFGGSPTGTVAQDATSGQAASTSAKYTSVPATAKVGIRNKLSVNPLPNTLYRVTVYAKSSNTFSDFMVRYTAATANSSSDGDYVNCQDYNTRSVSTSTWTKITCYIKTGATTPTTSYLYFVQESGTARDFAVDTASITLSDATTPNVQVGSGTNGGPTTLFTLDRGASAPIAGDNEALLGSMYYDTTLGKLQCYEADGWGACGSSPDNIITISPEYTNAVMHGTGVGTMTSDLCSDFLNINDGSSGQSTICGANETYNFYRWTSPQASDQTYSIFVTYQLPSTFKAFTSGSTSLQARVDSTTNASVKMQIFKNHAGSNLATCGSDTTITTSSNTWQSPPASGTADPSTCGFAGNDSIVFKITMSSKSNANAYIGNIGFTYTNN